LAFWLQEQGFEATHVDLENLKSSPDPDIWAWAAANRAVVVSKDQGFLSRLQIGIQPKVLWINWGNTRKEVLIKQLALLLPEIVLAFDSGEWLVELSS
jgi:predicted nuclease of predicted toxin-antitoxin system